jgi:hypothetical protein
VAIQGKIAHQGAPPLAARGAAAIEALDKRPLIAVAANLNGNGELMTGSFGTKGKNRVGRTLLAAATLTVLGAGLAGCGGGDRERPEMDLAAAQISTIGVNSYLWRASLETLAFMPLLQADSAGGVLVTDWYANPENPNERVKVSVAILDEDLRADAIRVAASRQVLQGGTWVEAPVQAATVQRLEDIILTKARDIRRSSIG